MEVQFYGANCIRLSDKKANIVIDDNLADLGQKNITKPGDIALFTGAHGDADVETKITIDTPGEYEVSGVSIHGVPARAHIDDEKQHNAVIYRLITDDLRIAVMGHVHPDLSDDELEEIGTIDVLFVPVGGNGYTLDGLGALKVIRKIEPKIVIPTHYADGKLNYPVPQQTLEDALKNMSMEASETVDKLKIKSSELGEGTRLIVVNRS